MYISIKAMDTRTSSQGKESRICPDQYSISLNEYLVSDGEGGKCKAVKIEGKERRVISSGSRGGKKVTIDYSLEFILTQAELAKVIEFADQNGLLPMQKVN